MSSVMILHFHWLSAETADHKKIRRNDVENIPVSSDDTVSPKIPDAISRVFSWYVSCSRSSAAATPLRSSTSGKLARNSFILVRRSGINI